MTFSLMAICHESGRVGNVVTSSSICVASRCSFVRAGVGAAQSQNITDPELGPLMLSLSAGGLSPREVLDKVVTERANIDWRQLGMVDMLGRTACYSGDQSLGVYATAEGVNCVAMGNMLDNTGIPQAMVTAFENSEGDFPERLLEGSGSRAGCGR